MVLDLPEPGKRRKIDQCIRRIATPHPTDEIDPAGDWFGVPGVSKDLNGLG